MRQTIKKIYGAVLASFICTLFVGSTQALVLPKTAKLVPPETILLADTDNFSQLKLQFEKTNLYKLYKDPAMAAVVEDFKTKRREKIRNIENDLIRTIVDTDLLPQGRVAVALVRNLPAAETEDANQISLLFISQWGENTKKIKEAVDKMVEKVIEDGAHRKTEDFRGVNITTIIPKSSNTLHYCFIDDRLIGSTNQDVLKFVIAHIQGAASPALSDDADYTATMKSIGPYHDIDFYVNIKQIVKIFLSKDASGNTKTMMTNLGLDNVTSFGTAIGFARGSGGSSISKILLKINGPKKGIFKLLDIESTAFKTPQFIPASAYSVTLINLNIKKAYDELYNILLSFSPQYAAITQIPLLPASPQGEPGLKLKSDIIAYLGSQIVIVRSIDKQTSNPLPSVETLVAAAIDNRGALEKTLSLLYDKLVIPGNPEARRELLGHTIYLADLSVLVPAYRPDKKIPLQTPSETGSEEQLSLRGRGLPMGQASDISTAQKPSMLAFTFTDTHLIFGSESDVEHIIRTISSTGTMSAVSAKWFTAAKSNVPSVVGLAGFQDNTTLSEVFWQILKERPKSTNKGQDEDPNIELSFSIGSKSLFTYLLFSSVDDLFDVSLLPEFNAVRKYFGLSAYYGVSSPEGFSFQFKYLNPVQTGD